MKRKTVSTFSARVEDYWLSQRGDKLSCFKSQDFVGYQNVAFTEEYPVVL